MTLFATFGPPVSDDGPLLLELQRLVGKTVRALVTDPGDNQQLLATGTLHHVESEDFPELLGCAVRLIIQCGATRKAVEIPTDRSGSTSWDSPRLRGLTITVGDERVFVIADAREIRKLDEIEDALGGALVLQDPVQRHERLEAIVKRAWSLGQEAADPHLRQRLSGLALFLAEYWPPEEAAAQNR